MRHLVGLLLVATLAGCGPEPPGPGPASTTPTQAIPSSGSPLAPGALSPSAASPAATPPPSSPIAAAASPTPAPTDEALPNPGGTCTAAQFASGPAQADGEPTTLFTKHVLVVENVRNTGRACILAQPKVIGLAADSGPYTAFTAPSLGQLVMVGTTGHYVYPPSYTIRAGQSFLIDINAYWWYSPAGASPPPQFPCHDPLTAIDRAELPLASGALQVAWSPPFPEVCTTPPSLSIGFEFK